MGTTGQAPCHLEGEADKEQRSESDSQRVGENEDSRTGEGESAAWSLGGRRLGQHQTDAAQGLPRHLVSETVRKYCQVRIGCPEHLSGPSSWAPRPLPATPALSFLIWKLVTVDTPNSESSCRDGTRSSRQSPVSAGEGVAAVTVPARGSLRVIWGWRQTEAGELGLSLRVSPTSSPHSLGHC